MEILITEAMENLIFEKLTKARNELTQWLYKELLNIDKKKS